MKKKISILLCTITALAATSCKKWLDVKPNTQVETSRLFSSENGFQDAMYGVYTTMAGSALYGDQLTMSFLDVLAQRYNCSATTHTFQKASIYNYQDGSTRARIDNIWDSMYNAIVNVNNILVNMDARKHLFQPGNYELLKGEALGIRAFLHFDLLRLFGPSYISGPAKLSIPYVTTVSGGVTPFSTVAKVLDTVIAELTTASNLLSGYKTVNSEYYAAENQLPNDWLNRRQNHFNYWAAEATLARVYLYKGDKTNALLHATNVIGSTFFRFQDADRITVQKDRTFIPEHVFALSKFNMRPQVAAYFQVAAGVNSTSLNANTQLTNTYGNGGVVDQLYEISAGGVSDIRYARLWELSGTIYFCSKFWQDAPNQIYANQLPLLRLPELYYIAAECSDPATATNYLNTIRAKRGLQLLPEGLDATTVQGEIFKEYQKEFYAEGQLFYYYKRLNMAQIRFTSLPASDNVYVLPLPDDEKLYRDK